MSIMDYNGGTLVAMRGKNCVCIASDLRLGEQMLTLAVDKCKVYKMGERLYLGVAGLATDAQTIVERLTFRKNLYELREGRALKPETFASMVSNLLYERRFGPYFCEPIVAGLHPVTHESYVAGTDLIGCLSSPEDFVCTGSGSDSVIGACEAFWEKDMDADALFQATSQALLSALERDARSGWGAVCYVITPEGVSIRTLKPRLD